MGVEKKDKLPDAGLVANRYTFYLDSKAQRRRQARRAPGLVGSHCRESNVDVHVRLEVGAPGTG